MSVNEQLRDKIERISNLPTLPEVASRLMKVINDPETSAHDIGQIVSQDVSLSAKIIRLANSAFYGVPRSITNINAAVVVLGFKVIGTMVLSLTVFDMFPPGKKSAPFDRRGFWRHCLTCGVLAKLITETATGHLVEPDDAFCAGLLHDIGKVVMEQYLHEDFQKVLDSATQNAMSFYQAESALLDYSHTDVADWLTSNWELPDTLYYPLVYHHTPGKSGQCTDIVNVCHLADHLSYSPELTLADGLKAPPLEKESANQAGLSDEQLKEIVGRVPDELEKLDFFRDLIGNG